MPRDAAKLGPLEPLVGYHLRRASAIFALDFIEAMAGTGMRQALVAVLAVISANSGINQGTIGLRLGIKRANMVALINELIDRRLVLREVSAADRRAFALSLTDDGRTMLADALDRIGQHEGLLLAGLSVPEQRTLLGLLGRIAERGVAIDDQPTTISASSATTPSSRG